MRKDHRPYFLIKAVRAFEKWYAGYFVKPHFDCLGNGYIFDRPWNIIVIGGPIKLGAYANIIGCGERKVRLTVWSDGQDGGAITVGDSCLICPGVRISSACSITIGDNCMFANMAFITDADWHGLYNRVSIGKREPVSISDNVWIGDSAIVCKGVSIGENSIVGTGAVVTSDVPPNSIVAGNPARVVKKLDPDAQIKTRNQWMEDFYQSTDLIERLEKKLHKNNTFFGYLRYLIKPGLDD